MADDVPTMLLWLLVHLPAQPSPPSPLAAHDLSHCGSWNLSPSLGWISSFIFCFCFGFSFAFRFSVLALLQKLFCSTCTFAWLEEEILLLLLLAGYLVLLSTLYFASYIIFFFRSQVSVCFVLGSRLPLCEYVRSSVWSSWPWAQPTEGKATQHNRNSNSNRKKIYKKLKEHEP